MFVCANADQVVSDSRCSRQFSRFSAYLCQSGQAAAIKAPDSVLFSSAAKIMQSCHLQVGCHTKCPLE